MNIIGLASAFMMRMVITLLLMTILEKNLRKWITTMKIIFFLFAIISFSFFSIVNSQEREAKLNELFNQLKNNSDVSSAFEIEMKIWNIWSTHPSQENLTQLLAKGSNLMSEQKLNKAYEAFSIVVGLDPNWAEGWNKRATVLYMLGRYQESQEDIDEVLKLEKRHFGALSGQGLVQIELKNYERAINSYKEVQKIYPSMMSPKIMIPQLKELIKSKSI